jgi:hypothetical protein
VRDYSGKDNYGRPKEDYINKLISMNDEELYDETRQMIFLSAHASNNPRSDYHWQCDACYDVWTDNRKNPDGYKKAYQDEYAANFG